MTIRQKYLENSMFFRSGTGLFTYILKWIAVIRIKTINNLKTCLPNTFAHYIHNINIRNFCCTRDYECTRKSLLRSIDFVAVMAKKREKYNIIFCGGYSGGNVAPSPCGPTNFRNGFVFFYFWPFAKTINVNVYAVIYSFRTMHTWCMHTWTNAPYAVGNVINVVCKRYNN